MVRQKLSVVIPVKNQKEKIMKCLESVKWADEIIIIDGFSTNGTIEICKKYTNKIIQYKHKGDYYGVSAEERNLGIDNSTGDWILQLDADEIVTEQLKSDLGKILSDARGKYIAYKFRRKNFFLGNFMRYGGWYHYSLHFFKKRYARYKGDIHEKLIVDGPIGVLEGAVEHYPFDSISDFIDRHNSYSTREAELIFKTKEVLPQRAIIYNLTIKPLKLFWKFYIKKQGFRDGMYGFIFSVLFAWVHFLNWAKYWEIIKDTERGA